MKTTHCTTKLGLQSFSFGRHAHLVATLPRNILLRWYCRFCTTKQGCWHPGGTRAPCMLQHAVSKSLSISACAHTAHPHVCRLVFSAHKHQQQPHSIASNNYKTCRRIVCHGKSFSCDTHTYIHYQPLLGLLEQAESLMLRYQTHMSSTPHKSGIDHRVKTDTTPTAVLSGLY